MKQLPIVEREMIVSARSPRMHWTRFTYAALGVLFCLQYFLLWQSLGLAQIGGYAFQTLAWLAFLFAGGGFALTADSVSSERREGTLGLLLLTRIGVHSVIAGKLASAGLGAVMGLLAMVPMLMLPVLAGGVRWTQVLFVTVPLPGLLFFSLSVGLWASSGVLQMARALRRGAILVVLILVLPLILGKLQTTVGATRVEEWIQGFSPAAAFLWGVNSTAGTLSRSDYWESVACGYGFGVIALLLAARSIRCNWCHAPLPATAISSKPTNPHQPISDRSPVRWLLLRSNSQRRTIWLGCALLVLPDILNVIARFSGLNGVGMVYALHLMIAFAAAIILSHAGANFFLEGRRDGSLELLRTTPEGSNRIVSDQLHVLRERLRRPLVLCVLATAMIGLTTWDRWMLTNPVLQLLQSLAEMIGTVVDVVALTTLGVWFGYSKRTIASALLWPVGLVLGLDVVLSYSIWFAWGLLFRGAASSGAFGTLSGVLLMIVPSLLLIAKQIWLIRWARRRLNDLASGAAAEPLDLGRSILLEAKRARTFVRRARHWTGGGA